MIAGQKIGQLATADEIAALVAYLASGESVSITEQEFVIDGGGRLDAAVRASTPRS